MALINFTISSKFFLLTIIVNISNIPPFLQTFPLSAFIYLERQNIFFQVSKLLEDLDVIVTLPWVGERSKYLQVVERTKNKLLCTDGEMSRMH